MKKSQISKFQKKTQQQFIRYLFFIMVLVIVVYNLLFWLYLSNQQTRDLNETQTSITDKLNDVTKDYETILSNELINQNLEAFFEGQAKTQDILYQFYNQVNQMDIPFEMIVFSNDHHVLLSTIDDIKVTDSFVLKLMVEKADRPIKILRVSSNKSYLVNTQTLDHGTVVFLTADDVVHARITQQPTDYAIMSHTNSVFIISDQSLEEGYLSKVNQGLLKRNSTINDNSYRSQVHPYNENISILSFSQQNDLLIPNIIGSGLIFVVGLGLLVVFLISSRRVVSMNSESVNELSDKMNELKKGDIERLDIQTDDEIQTIAHQINDLNDTLKLTHHENLKLVEIAHQFEIKQLLASFNPHFLYNTLETIRSAMYYDTELSSELMLLLTKVLRYSLEEQSIVSIKKDLGYLEDYLKIQKIRHGDKLNYEINVNEQDFGIMIPKLIIQPLIENSIKYGLKEQKKLSLTITIDRIDDRVRIRLIDSGPGISEEVIEHSQKPSTHGIYNSRRRLELYDQDSTFIIRQAHPKGTHIVLVFRRKHV